MIIQRVYRGWPRNILLCAAFALGTVFFAAVAGRTAETSVPGAVGAGALALLMAYVSVRCAMMKAIATADGIGLHGPLITQNVRWSAVTRVASGDTETDVRLLAVRAPVLHLHDGRRIKVRMASTYNLWPGGGGRRDAADRIAAELDALRTASAPQ